MERDAKAFDVAVSQLKVIAVHGMSETATEQLAALRSQENNLLAPVVSDDIVSLECVSNRASNDANEVAVTVMVSLWWQRKI
jgi:hypothetical protein